LYRLLVTRNGIEDTLRLAHPLLYCACVSRSLRMLQFFVTLCWAHESSFLKIIVAETAFLSLEWRSL
jgi:hypothetical protein